MAEQQGLVHIYYGDGKGKTTAAFGLAFRCAGWGKRAVIAQFLKSSPCGEVTAAERFPELTVLRSKGIRKFTFQMDEAEKAATAAECAALFQQAVELAQLSLEALCSFLDHRPAGLEVVLTGHSLPEQLAARAHYITRMAKEKHPYDQGVTARREIEF